MQPELLAEAVPQRSASWRKRSVGRWEKWAARQRERCPPCSGASCPARVRGWAWSWVWAPAGNWAGNWVWGWAWSRGWGPFLPSWERVFVEGVPYCAACLPAALLRRFAACHLAGAPPPPRPAHRIPLGLLLVSRGWLTPGQLRNALGRQRRHGGRLGDALRGLGYVNEEQITAVLAMQWACPVLAFRSLVSERHLRRVPLCLQELHQMVSVHYSEHGGVLLLAFSAGVNYTVTQALAGMLDCRIEPCLASETEVRRNLGALQGLDRTSEITFERVRDADEKSAITQSYIQRWGARRVRVTACGTAVWARLERTGQTLDLVFDAATAGASAA